MTTKIRIAAFALAGALVAVGFSAHAQLPPDNAVGPGVGGQVYAFAFDPLDTTVAYAGAGVDGGHKLDVQNGIWAPWPHSLHVGDLIMSCKVDDMLAVRGADPALADHRGVYTATLVVVYYRGFNDASWACKTDIASRYYGADFVVDHCATHPNAKLTPTKLRPQNRAAFGTVGDESDIHITL